MDRAATLHIKQKLVIRPGRSATTSHAGGESFAAIVDAYSTILY